MSNAEVSPQDDFSPRKNLYQIFGVNSLSKRQKIKTIGNLDEVYGYDLVSIIYLILETGLSGYLNVVNQKNEISGIVFSNGKIVKIDLPDKDTLFGQLLIQEGYVSLESLNKLIQTGSASLGEQLISNKIITKEQFIELLLKQMRLRLSKYINQVMYRINFVESDEGNTLFSIDQNQYLSLAHDWIAGRFEIKWLTMHYMEFLSSQVIIKETELMASEIKELPLVKMIFEKKLLIAQSKNLEGVLTALKATNESDLFLKSVHFLVLAGFIQFVESQQQAEEKSKSYIQKIYSNMIKKSDVEMLESVASILKVKPTDIDGIYNEINRAIERSSEQADEEIKIELSRLSLEILSRKKHFIDEYNKVHSKVLAAQEVDKQLIEQIKLDLLQKNFYAAMNKLNKLKNLENQTPKIRLYLIWARVASGVYNKVYIDQKGIDRELIQILPEDKNSPDFYYVMSLISKLKNDKNDVAKFFNMAVKLDSIFESFSLAEETFGDKFKKIFNRKSSFILFLILIFSVSGRAQEIKRLSAESSAAPVAQDKDSKKSDNDEQNQAAATKIDVSESAQIQAELFSEEQLPFRYLNQYFSYEVTNDSKVFMNEKPFDLAQLQFSKENGRFVFSTPEQMARFFKVGEVIFYENGVEIDRKRFQLKENGFSLPILEIATSVCVQTKSTYSILRICKPLIKSDLSGVKLVSANDSELGQKGQIVVQDSEIRSNFKVEFQNGDSFFFETQRRKVYPAVINKWKDSSELRVRFVDLDVQTLAWEEILVIDQQFFEIKMDPLVMLRQDIFFPDNDLKSKAIAKTLINRKQLTIITKNKFSLNSMTGFSQLVGDNPNLTVKLRTGMGAGVSAKYSRNYRSKWDWYTQAHFLSTKILFEDATKILEGKSQSLLQVSAGTIYQWNKDWDMNLGLGLKSALFMEPININQGIEILSALNKFISVAMDWDLFSNNSIEVTMPFGIKGNLPGQAGSYTSQFGVQLDLGISGNFRLSWGRIFASAGYSSRQQNYGDFNFKEDFYSLNTGFIYLF